jgi:predicted unusual protein kinase regulating ubiquinone biosynthesis (AarF/ABC1/UbiB family)
MSAKNPGGLTPTRGCDICCETCHEKEKSYALLLEKESTVQSKIRLVRRMLQLFLLAFTIAVCYRLHYFCSLFYREETLKRRRARIHRRQSARITFHAIKLKGVLIKLGQFLSARVDILPDEFTQGLAQLQDAVPATDIRLIRGRIREELGNDTEAIFARFNPTPIAAASLGQVHEAVLISGQRVAVKVQYPDIHRIVEMDLRVARWAFGWLSHLYPHIKWDILHNEFSQILLQELDYLQEGHHAERFRQNFADDDRIIVPRVLWNYTTSHVLTLEFVEGIKITEFEAIRQSDISLPALARLLVESYMKQIFQHRFMHGDPHPGNLFVQPGPKLIFVDFGLMQPLTPKMQEGIRITVGGIIKRDVPRIVRGLNSLGFISGKGDLGAIERVASFFIEKYRDISPRALREIALQDITQDMEQVFSVASSIQIPNNFILMWRTAGILNGINSRLDPELNIVELAKPYAMPFIEEKSFIEQLFSSSKEAAGSFLILPRLLEEFLRTANLGEFKTKMSSEDVTGAILRVYRLGYRTILGAFALVLWTGSLMFEQYGYTTESFLSKVTAVILALMLAISLIRQTKG